MLAWCRERQLPLLILLNKVDKAKQKEHTTCLRALQEILGDYQLADVVLFSSKSGKGTGAVLQKIFDWFDLAAS